MIMTSIGPYACINFFGVRGRGCYSIAFPRSWKHVKHKIVWSDITQHRICDAVFPIPFFFFLSTLMSDVKRAMTDISSVASVNY
jgi:hypothetical protein